jgi:DNA-binding response OmpR family regulator
MGAGILVIDDEHLLRYSLATVLNRAKYSVTTAGNGLQGLSIFQSRKFDLVILDSQLPDIDSSLLLHHMLEISPRTKAIILTTDTREQTIQRLFQNGALVYLIKPLDPGILLAVISNLLQNKPVVKIEGVLPNIYSQFHH